MKSLVQSRILWISLLTGLSLVVFIQFKDTNFLTVLGSQNSAYEIAKLIAVICSTVFGFLLAAIAMLTAIMDRTLLVNMKKTGHYQIFIRDCFVNLFLLLSAIISGVVCLFLFDVKLLISFKIMLFFCVSSVCYFLEIGRRFWLIFSMV